MPENLYPGQPTIPEDQVFAMFLEVQAGMAAYAGPSLSEIYFPKSKDSEVLENGTGSLVDVQGTKLLVSNEHVIANEGLHHSFHAYDRFVYGAYKRYVMGKPFDVGASKIDDEVWSRYGTGSFAIPLDRFALRHSTHPHEILWTAGFPGARVKHLAATYAVGQALPTQEYVFREGEVPHEEFDANYHFAVGYSPEKAQPIDESSASHGPGLSDPHGLSGSLVWNTRRLDCFYAGRPWDPSMALVTGIIWGWPRRDYLIATKVEHFRDLLVVASQLPSTPDAAGQTGDGAGPEEPAPSRCSETPPWSS